MARKSNKTAHVLNLLAGHDTQPATDETPDTQPTAKAESASEGTAVKSEPAPEGDTAKAEEAVPGRPAPADSKTVASTASVQNISVIDTTGKDPVAELIQKNLSAQFDGGAANTLSKVPEGKEEPSAESNDLEAPAAASNHLEAAVADSPAIPTESDLSVATDYSLSDDAAVEPITDSFAADMADEPITDSFAADTAVEPITDSFAADTADEPITDSSAADTAVDSITDFSAADTAVTTEDTSSVNVPTPEPLPEPTPISVPTPEPVTSVPVPDPESVPGPGPTTIPKKAEEPESVPESELEPEPDFVYLNVMETIVKDKIIYYMRQFDVCTCDRCVTDTIALTMNGLTPKYIVTSPAAVDPLIGFYTNKLISDITVEATKACITVKDNPRHS